MEHNTNIDKINRIAVYDKLQNLSEKYLTGLQEAYLNIFANEAKRIADNTLDDFIHVQENIYTSDILRGIKDNARLLAFTDVQTGYRRQMQKWVKSNPIEVTKQTISIDNMPGNIPLVNQEAFKRSMTTLGIGTLGVVGLRFVTGTKWTWLAELAAFAASGKAYVSGKEIDDRKRKQLQEKWVRSRKLSIISSIKHDLDSWFDLAEKENRRILKSFNIE